MKRVEQLRFDARDWESLLAGLFRRSDVESAALLFAEQVSGRTNDILVVREVVHVPDSAFHVRELDQIEIEPVAFNRLTRPARDRGLAVITVHTHPMASEPWFSRADDMGDRRLMPSLANRIPGRWHGSMVVVPGPDTVARVFDDGRAPRPVSVRVVGRHVTSYPLAAPGEHERMYARQVLALGAAGQAALRGLRVGVVGLGGTGSVVAAQLAHIGVGELVLVDDDRVEVTNLSRVLGAAEEDIGSLKVDVASRYASRCGANVVGLASLVAQPDDLTNVADCDVIMSCVDRDTPRALLNRLSYSAFVPVIDMGSQFRVDPSSGRLTGDAGRVVIAGPGRPCFACGGIVDPARLAAEALTSEARAELADEGYVSGIDVPAPSVMPFNTMLAGAAVIELLRMVTGFGSDEAGFDRLGFSFSRGGCKPVGLASPRLCGICGGISMSIDDQDPACAASKRIAPD